MYRPADYQIAQIELMLQKRNTPIHVALLTFLSAKAVNKFRIFVLKFCGSM